MLRKLSLSLALIGAGACAPDYDVILRNGTIYDGSGAPPITADVGLSGDTIAFIGDLSDASGATDIDVTGLAVAPGFINVLSWATESLIEDGARRATSARASRWRCSARAGRWGRSTTT